MERKDFVSKVSELLQIAKPHLSCEYGLGKDIPLTKMDEFWASQNNGVRPYADKDEYVLVNCDNGYRYEINITGNSLCCIAEEVFKKMACK